MLPTPGLVLLGGVTPRLPEWCEGRPAGIRIILGPGSRQSGSAACWDSLVDATMKRILVVPCLLIAVAGLAQAPQAAESVARVQGQAKVDRGLEMYQRYCRSCHGEWGAGDGSVGKWLKVPPADLTQLSESNEGVFPLERVTRAIDGRDPVEIHGPREMPIWGTVLGEPNDGDPEIAAKIDQIVKLVRYLDTR